MPRVHIDVPERLPFQTILPVTIRDINYANHLGNDALVSFTGEARIRFFQALGFASEQDVAGAGLIVTDLAVMYKGEGFHGDMLRVEMAADDFNKYGCDLVYRMVRQADEKLIAVAKTGILFFDYTTRKPLARPEVFLERYQALLDRS